MNNKVGISIFVGIMVILVANILATEYRIYREKIEHDKLEKGNQYTCPACPKCST